MAGPQGLNAQVVKRYRAGQYRAGRRPGRRRRRTAPSACWAAITPRSRPASTTWRCCCRPPAATPRPSRSTGARWRIRRARPSAPSTRTCDAASDRPGQLAAARRPPAATPRPSRSTGARWRSASRPSAPSTPTSPPASTTWRSCSRPGPLRRGRAALPARAGDPGAGPRPRAPGRGAEPQQPGGAAADQGRYAEAEPLYRRALAIREQALGPEHPDVATSLNNLAALLQTRAATPRPSRSTGARWRSASRPSAPSTRTWRPSLNNLAVLLQTTAATPRPSRSTSARWRSGSRPSAPSTRTWRPSLNNLAELLQTRAATPRPSRSTGARWRSTSRPSAPSTRTSRPASTTWRRCCETTGRYAEAEPLYRRALAIHEKALGPEHPDVATDLNNLAELLQTTAATPRPSRSTGARWRSDEQALGPEHPDVATDLNNLAVLLETTGRYAEAEPLYRRALAICEKALGPEHPARGDRASTTWRSCFGPPAATPRPSRSTGARWRSTSRPSAPSTRPWPATSTTWRGCSRPPAATPRPSRSTGARWPSPMAPAEPEAAVECPGQSHHPLPRPGPTRPRHLLRQAGDQHPAGGAPGPRRRRAGHPTGLPQEQGGLLQGRWPTS